MQWFELFETPWTWPPSEHAQSSDYDQSVHLLLDDTRKNVLNVLLMVNEKDPADFQLVLVSSIEALHLTHFCKSDFKHMLKPGLIGEYRDIRNYAKPFEDKLKSTMECEDPQRRTPSGRRGIQKKYEPLLDAEQQALAYWWTSGDKYPKPPAKGKVDDQFNQFEALRDHIAQWWSTRHCVIFDPRALPTADGDDFLKYLLPLAVLAKLDNATRDSYRAALVEVLALAGARTSLHSKAFKQEFKRRITQNEKFQQVFLKVRHSMGLPVDPLEISSMQDSS